MFISRRVVLQSERFRRGDCARPSAVVFGRADCLRTERIGFCRKSAGAHGRPEAPRVNVGPSHNMLGPNALPKLQRRRAAREMLRIAAARRRRTQRRRAIAADLARDFRRQRARHLDTEKRRNSPALRPEAHDERLASDDASWSVAAAGSSSPRTFDAAPGSVD